MLQPKKLKYTKFQVKRLLRKGLLTRGTELTHGEAGIQALETKLVSSKEIEAVINQLRRGLGRRGRYWLRIFPHFPKTKKPPETRMGGGKGDIEDYVAIIKKGMVILEVGGLDIETLKEVLKQCAYKLSFKSRIITQQK